MIIRVAYRDRWSSYVISNSFCVYVFRDMMRHCYVDSLLSSHFSFINFINFVYFSDHMLRQFSLSLDKLVLDTYLNWLNSIICSYTKSLFMAWI